MLIVDFHPTLPGRDRRAGDAALEAEGDIAAVLDARSPPS